MILDAHGLRVDLPRGWSGRVFSSGGLATLHAGDYQLALHDGQFGDRSTGMMPAVGSFIALTEYRPGSGLEPGAGLFAPRRLPRPLDPTSFAVNRLAHPRPGQTGTQHFLTASERPLCLYVVLSGGRAVRRRQLAVIDRLLGSLRVSRRV